jgi:hypothetical protein
LQPNGAGDAEPLQGSAPCFDALRRALSPATVQLADLRQAPAGSGAGSGGASPRHVLRLGGLEGLSFSEGCAQAAALADAPQLRAGSLPGLGENGWGLAADTAAPLQPDVLMEALSDSGGANLAPGADSCMGFEALSSALGLKRLRGGSLQWPATLGPPALGGPTLLAAPGSAPLGGSPQGVALDPGFRSGTLPPVLDAVAGWELPWGARGAPLDRKSTSCGALRRGAGEPPARPPPPDGLHAGPEAAGKAELGDGGAAPAPRPILARACSGAPETLRLLLNLEPQAPPPPREPALGGLAQFALGAGRAGGTRQARDPGPGGVCCAGYQGAVRARRRAGRRQRRPPCWLNFHAAPRFTMLTLITAGCSSTIGRMGRPLGIAAAADPRMAAPAGTGPAGRGRARRVRGALRGRGAARARSSCGAGGHGQARVPAPMLALSLYPVTGAVTAEAAGARPLACAVRW